jgi:hypothetical protein
VGTDPVQLAAGRVDAGNDLDLAVANAGNDTVQVFLGGDNATFTPDATLDSPGELRGVAVSTFFGTGGDVAISYDEAATGKVGMFLRESSDSSFATTPITGDLERPAGPLISFDAGNDQRIDVLSLDRETDASEGNVVIARTERLTPIGGGTSTFGWAETPIIYPAGRVPTRIVPVDFNADSNIDLIVPNSGSGANGNNVAVYIGLGRYEFSNANIYWTDGVDTPPQDVTLMPWHLSHSFAGNQISLSIDATVLFSLADIPAEELLRGDQQRLYFILDMMTTNAPIDFNSREQEGILDQDFGVVREHFTQPVVVPMTVGFLDNNASHDLVPLPAATPEVDIVDWQIEAN